jgi:hypothetical protein
MLSVDVAVHGMLIRDGAGDQWSAQDRVVPWRRSLSEDTDGPVAAALHEGSGPPGRRAKDSRADSTAQAAPPPAGTP